MLMKYHGFMGLLGINDKLDIYKPALALSLDPAAPRLLSEELERRGVHSTGESFLPFVSPKLCEPVT